MNENAHFLKLIEVPRARASTAITYKLEILFVIENIHFTSRHWYTWKRILVSESERGTFIQYHLQFQKATIGSYVGWGLLDPPP